MTQYAGRGQQIVVRIAYLSSAVTFRAIISSCPVIGRSVSDNASLVSPVHRNGFNARLIGHDGSGSNSVLFGDNGSRDPTPVYPTCINPIPANHGACTVQGVTISGIPSRD